MYYANVEGAPGHGRRREGVIFNFSILADARKRGAVLGHVVFNIAAFPLICGISSRISAFVSMGRCFAVENPRFYRSISRKMVYRFGNASLLNHRSTTPSGSERSRNGNLAQQSDFFFRAVPNTVTLLPQRGLIIRDFILFFQLHPHSKFR